VKPVEPPSCNIVLIGKNSRGQWVARERDGLYGGLFVSQQAAVRYALFENHHHPEAIISIATPLELDTGAIAAADAIDRVQPRRAA